MDDTAQRRRFRFGLRTLFEIIALAAFILTLIYYRTSAVTETGRYQLQVVPNGANREKWVIDTQTVQVWMHESSAWDKSTPPVLAK